MEQYHNPRKVELFLLILILSPVMVAAQQNSQPWVGIIVVVFSFIFLLIATAVAVLVHRFCYTWLGGAAEIDHEQQGMQAARGLEAAAVAALPTLKFSEIRMHRLGDGELECAVCLYEFKDHETLCLLPDCFHVFHPDCIAPWLASHVTCPVCRATLELGEGSPVSMAYVLHRISGADHHDRDDDDHLTVGIGRSSSEVNQKGEFGEESRHRSSIGRLPRCHSTGQLLVRVVGEIRPNINIMWPNEMSPRSDYRVIDSKPNLHRWGCFATAPTSPNQTAR